MINLNTSITLVTHGDLDGVSCYVLAKHFFRNADEFRFVDYKDVNDVVERIVDAVADGTQGYGDIYITDISVNERLAKKIDALYNEGTLPITLIDHHATALWLNKYKWATVIAEYPDGRKASGTSLFYDAIKKAEPVNNSGIIATYVDMVRLYDTFSFEIEIENPNSKRAEELHYVFMEMMSKYNGNKIQFANLMEYSYLNAIGTTFPEWDNDERFAIKRQIEREDKAYETAKKTFFIIDQDGMKVGWWFGNVCISKVCNRFCKDNPEIVYCVNFNPGFRTLDFRTIRNDIDLGKDVASKFGGSGHPKAAGAQLSDDTLKAIINTILEKARK